jgi:hypothetical protein
LPVGETRDPVPVGGATVVYIAGYGRSGSTLLDLLLGRVERWFSMGEFRLVWHALRDGWRCACGAEVGDCPVWHEVVQRAGVTDVAPVLADLRTTLRVRRVPGLLAPVLLGRHRAAYARAVGTLASMYAAASDVSGARVLVDSSKDPMYGLVLARVPGITLHVVHLVRDSRAVAWSWQRKRLRPEIGDTAAYMPLRSASRTSLDWDLRNALTHALGRRAATYTRLTYESLVDDHDAAVEMIARVVTGDAVTVASCADRPNHTVAGNPMRFDAALDVRPDVEWRQRLSAPDRRVVSALTWPLLRLYGYRVRDGSA